MLIVLTLLAYAATAAFDFPPLLKAKRRGEMATAGLIWLVALVYSILLIRHVALPDINAPIEGMFGQP